MGAVTLVKNALDAFAKDSARLWEHDRSQTIGASEIGQCARRVYFSKNEGDHVHAIARDEGYDDRWGAKIRGTFYENTFWAPAIKAAFGDNALFLGEDQRTLVDGYLSATTDALLINLPTDALAYLGVPDLGSDSIPVDCKSLDPRINLRGKPKPEHEYQLQVQMGLIRARTNHKPNFGLVTYTDTSFWDSVQEFVVPFDQAIFDAAKARAVEIMSAKSPGDLKPEGAIAGGKECANCPFTAACGQARAAMVPSSGEETVPADIAEPIVAKACKVKDLKTRADAMETEAKALEHEVKEMLRDAGTRRLKHDGVSISYSAVAGRKSFDNKALQADAAAAGFVLSKYERSGEPGDRLTISVPE